MVARHRSYWGEDREVHGLPIGFPIFTAMFRSLLFLALLLPLCVHAQVDSTHSKVRPWAQFMLGSRLPGGFFGCGGGVELGRLVNPALVFGLGGGPDGATIAVGNEVRVWRTQRTGLQGWGYWNYAFGRVQEDEFVSGYRTTTDPSTSVKGGVSFLVQTDTNLSIALRAGFSWALDIPMVTVQRPTVTTSASSTDGYSSDSYVPGVAAMIWL
jgi:hypothetical protein